MIWTMEPTAKKLEDVETKVGNVGSTDLQSQVNALNSKFATPISATNISSKLSGVTAKYIKIGQVVIVFATFKANKEILSTDNLFTLPIPLGWEQAVIPIADKQSGLGDGNVIYIRNTGECRLFCGLQAGKSINASGAYICES